MRERGATNSHSEIEEGETNGRRTPHTYRKEKEEEEATVLRERERGNKKAVVGAAFFHPSWWFRLVKKSDGIFSFTQKSAMQICVIASGVITFYSLL